MLYINNMKGSIKFAEKWLKNVAYPSTLTNMRHLAQTPTLVKDGSKTLAPAATIFRIVFF